MTGIVIALVACTDVPELEVVNEAKPAEGPSYLTLRLIDAPTDDLSEVWVTIDAIDARGCNDTWITLPLEHEQDHELLALQDNFATLVSLVELPYSSICELRFSIPQGHVVTQGGEVVTLEVPSGKIKVKGDISLEPGVATQVTVDFDAEKSIHLSNDDRYILKPVIHVEDVSHVPLDGTPLREHQFLGSTTFEVHPWTDETFIIGPDATLTFSPGSVDESIEFTASRWQRPSNASLGEVFIFSPSYDFLVPPLLTVADEQPGVSKSVYVEKQPQQTSCAQGSCSAEVPHFSPVEICRNFSDIPLDDPPFDSYVYYVHEAACHGLVDEQTNEAFRPTEPITRAELVSIISRLVTQPTEVGFEGQMPFLDLQTPEATQLWYYELAGWAHAEGIVTGNQEGDQAGMFRGDDLVTREEAAAIFVRGAAASRTNDGAATASYGEIEPFEGIATTTFSDVFNHLEWYYEYVYAMRNAGLMLGYQDGSFGLGQNMTRGEAATIACRASGHCSEVLVRGVPYQSQRVTGCVPNNLCGFASTNMLLSFLDGSEPTAAKLSQLAVHARGAQCPADFSNAEHYTDAAIFGGAGDSYFSTSWTYDDVKASLDQGQPVHVGLQYGELGDYRCANNFAGGHDVVVVGYSATFYTWTIHDPYCFGESDGAYRRIPSRLFRTAIDAAHEGLGIDGDMVVAVVQD